MLLPAIQKVRDAANRSVSQNNLKQITLATINYADQNRQELPYFLIQTASNTPTAYGYPNPQWGDTGSGGWGPGPIAYNVTGVTGSLFFLILPQLDNDPLRKQASTNSPAGTVPSYTYTPGSADANRIAGIPLKTLIAPADPTQEEEAARTSYLANQLVFQYWYTSPRSRFPASIKDGPPNTIAFAEGYSQAMNLGITGWTSWSPQTPTYGLQGPYNRDWAASSYIGYTAATTDSYQVAPKRNSTVQGQGPELSKAQSYSASGIMVGFFDGSARAVKGGAGLGTDPNGTTITSWYASSTPQNDDVPGADW